MAQVTSNKKSKLLILDDLGLQVTKTDPKLVNRLVSNSRHYNLSIVCLHQRLTQAPTIMRANADVVIAFSACSYPEIECLWKMVSTVPRREFATMFSEATQDLYGQFSRQWWTFTILQERF
jgi:hypothetical protein